MLAKKARAKQWFIALIHHIIPAFKRQKCNFPQIPDETELLFISTLQFLAFRYQRISMHRIPLLLAAVLFFLCIPSIAADPADGPDKAAEKFYAGYVALAEKLKDTKSYVAKSKLASADFKKSYAKKMSAKESVGDGDPVMQAQDTPTNPYKAGKAVIKDNKATVILSAKFGDITGKVSVQMILKDGVWQVNAVNEAK